MRAVLPQVQMRNEIARVEAMHFVTPARHTPLEL